MDLLVAFVIAMLITMALIPALERVAARLHMLDNPLGRKVHTQPIPRVGGVAMVIGALLPLVLWLRMDPTLAAYLLAVLVLVVFGIWDDRVGLNAFTKFAGQLLAVLIIMLAGHVSIDSLMLSEPVELPHWLGLSLTLLFLLGITNAINLADGLDGLAGGTTLLCCAALALLAQNWAVRFDETVAVVLMGALVGFLRFNTYPARVFMGDAGSQFLGFSVGVLSILLTSQTATPLSTALPLLLLGLPVLDTLSVMVLRLRAGHSPFAGDRQHFHHRLLALGFHHHEAVTVIYAVQCALLLLAWQLRFANDVLIVATFLGFALLTMGSLTLLERGGWRWRPVATPTHHLPLVRLRQWLRAGERLSRWCLRSAWLCTSVYLIGVALYTSPVPVDIGWLGAVCVLPPALAVLWRRPISAEDWLARGALYVAVMVAVYLDQRAIVFVPLLQAAKWAFLPLLVLSVIIALRVSGPRRFQVTPLDLLLIFGALALPNLPGVANAPHSLGLSLAKLVALCYAVEMIATVGSRLRTALFGTGAVFFTLIALRAFS
jgi:UDP-GlcNAc:undecaprenyl-phosphate/decaprenyl-phosphate GlcNAc-1-phosphate transferase